MDSPVGPPLASSSRRQNSFHGSVVSSASSRRNMLSDRAKNIRGEASKRIDGLLQDWREYKERADDELRLELCRLQANCLPW
ncbi:unnamed protein product [Clavelina lepadiformis]|uniref:Uncharacterized protein n=1 Tax=Clavelina lepadiformis TaxID=159417 RepID=A0ABP0H2W2_CLALP